MALALSKKPVHRGREANNFEDAGSEELRIMVDPAPTARDMAIMGESIAQQGEMTHRLMSKMVHVRLEKPYKGDPQATVIMTYGREQATPAGQDSYRDEGAGSNPVPASDRLFTQGAGQAPRWVPGNWVHWHLRFEEGPLGKCSCGADPEMIVGPEAIMPGPVARHWFGDWDVVAYELKTQPGQMLENWLTRTWHRDRVAAENWGGYVMDFPKGVSAVFDSKGAINYKALKKYAPPEIPHVAITRLDTMMRRLPNTEAKPWEIFKWGDVCEKGPRMHFFDDASGGDDKMQQMIAQAVAAALAAERATQKGKSA